VETSTFDIQAAVAQLDALENDNAMAPDVIEVREDDVAFNIDDEMDEGGCPLSDRLRFAMNELDGHLGRGQRSRRIYAALESRQFHSAESSWAPLLSVALHRRFTVGWVYFVGYLRTWSRWRAWTESR
jgi:hypothetical protein